MNSKLLKISAGTFIPILNLLPFFHFNNMKEIGYLFTIYIFVISFFVFLINNTISLKIDNDLNKIFLFYLLIELVSLARGEILGTLTISRLISLPLFYLSFYIITIYQKDNYNYLRIINRSIFFLTMLNLVAYFLLNIKSPEIHRYTNVIRTNFSFEEYRIFLPFTESTRTFSQILGLSCIISIYQYKLTKKSLLKITYILLILLNLSVIILIDSRMVLFVTLLLIVFFNFSKFIILTINKRLIIIGIGLILFFPFIYTFLYTFLYTFYNPTIDFTINGRIPIWLEIFFRSLAFDNYNKIFGFGAYSQITSGLSYYYGQSFANTWSDSLAISAHNAFLQRILDHGIFGTLIFLYFIGKIITKFKRNNYYYSIILLVYLFSIGITESIFSFYSLSFLFIFMVIISKAFTKTSLI